MDDADLVRRARAGEGDAFAALVRPHVEAAIRLAYVITGSVSDAEEATQEGFVHAYRALSRFDTDRPLRPWLLRIVANAAKNRGRAQRRRHRHEARLAVTHRFEPAGSAEDRALAAVAEADLVAALERLGERERRVIVYRYFAGLSEQETAEAMNCPVGTVKSRHARALEQLRRMLSEPSDA